MNQGAGKGDRPRQVDPKKYAEGWERIFGNRGYTMKDQFHPDDVKLRDHGKNSKKKTNTNKGVATFEEIKDQRGFETDPQSLLFRKFHVNDQ